jgi:hypothetical protein
MLYKHAGESFRYGVSEEATDRYIAMLREHKKEQERRLAKIEEINKEIAPAGICQIPVDRSVLRYYKRRLEEVCYETYRDACK